MNIKLPYGDGHLSIDIPEGRIKAILDIKSGPNSGVQTDRPPDEKEITRRALNEPIGCPPLRELTKGKRKVTVVTSDHTRPMPSMVTMPLILEEIRKGSPDAEILILVATGMHRATTEEELLARFGEEICANERIIVHDSRDKNTLRDIGTLPSGKKLELSVHALDTDLLIAEGFIEPHFFAGYSGGRKSVLPGVASYDCVVSNHSSEFIADRNAATGLLEGNPIHMDMVAAAELAGLAFILNVTLGEGRKIDGAFAGHPVAAHIAGCEELTRKSTVAKVSASIVITSNGGYPLDQNLYQLVKCMDTAEKCCDEGGVIIAVGECRDGVGSDTFFEDFSRGKSPEELTQLFLSRGPAETAADQWQSQILARILEKRSIIVVAPLIEESVRAMGLHFAACLESALSLAEDLLESPRDAGTNSPEADIVVLPDGPGLAIV